MVDGGDKLTTEGIYRIVGAYKAQGFDVFTEGQQRIVLLAVRSTRRRLRGEVDMHALVRVVSEFNLLGGARQSPRRGGPQSVTKQEKQYIGLIHQL